MRGRQKHLSLPYGDATDNSAWKTKLQPIKNADGRRDVYLDKEQRNRFVAEAAEDVGKFLRALNSVPLRPGAMAQRLVKHFDPRLSTLSIANDKGGAERRITLPPATDAIFAECAGKRGGEEPLLVRTNGLAWNKDSWYVPVKEAAAAAGLPAKATAYAMRHGTITDLLMHHRLDTLTVSQLSGTSLVMIEKHYGHLLRDHAQRRSVSW